MPSIKKAKADLTKRLRAIAKVLERAPSEAPQTLHIRSAAQLQIECSKSRADDKKPLAMTVR